MSIEALKGIFIFLIIPLIGIFGYLWLARKMAFSNVQNAPYGGYFVIFAGYGLILVLALATLMLGWSLPVGLILLGAMTIGLAAIVIVAAVNDRVQEPTVYHRWVSYLCTGYVFSVLLLWAMIDG